MDPDGQVRGACFARLEELDRNRSRFQDIAVEGLVTFEELEAASVDAQRKSRELQRCVARLEELEKVREILPARFAEVMPEAPDELTSEVRHQVYRMLRLEVRVMPNGDLDVCGVIADHVYVQKATSSQTAKEELAPVGAAFVSHCSYGDTSPSLMARTAA